MNSIWERFLIKDGEPPRERYPVCAVDSVNPDFFSALGIPLLRQAGDGVIQWLATLK